MGDDYDGPWKEAIERHFADFLLFFFPSAHAQIDWSQPLVFLDQVLRAAIRDTEIGKRIVDKLARVTRRGGEEEWIYLHLEVQGQLDASFAERMFVCHSRLFDRYRKPIASLAVLADERPNWRPDSYSHEALDCRIEMRYPTVKLLDWVGSEARLEDSTNPFSVVTLAHLATQVTRNDPSARYLAKCSIAKRLYRMGLERRQLIDFFNVIDWLMSLPKSLASAFSDNLMSLEEELKMPYMNSIERLKLEQGMVLGQARMLARLLARRFGELPDSVKSRLESATEDELEAWSDAMLTANAVDEVFGSSRA